MKERVSCTWSQLPQEKAPAHHLDSPAPEGGLVKQRPSPLQIFRKEAHFFPKFPSRREMASCRVNSFRRAVDTLFQILAKRYCAHTQRNSLFEPPIASH